MKSLLGFNPTGVRRSGFEHVIDPREATRFDFFAQTETGTVLFEVKLTETAFGQAKDDRRHRGKLKSIYEPLLRDKIAPRFLEPARFFEHH